jgi:osmotically-inducible protein OsmY
MGVEQPKPYLASAGRRAAATLKWGSVAVAACLMIGGDLTYRAGVHQPSPAAATMRGGPQPSNTAVRWLIQAQYRQDDLVAGGRIAVQADNGVVTLSGRVRDEPARSRAILLAGRVRGVTAVHDRLDVEGVRRRAE